MHDKKLEWDVQVLKRKLGGEHVNETYRCVSMSGQRLAASNERRLTAHHKFPSIHVSELKDYATQSPVNCAKTTSDLMPPTTSSPSLQNTFRLNSIHLVNLGPVILLLPSYRFAAKMTRKYRALVLARYRRHVLHISEESPAPLLRFYGLLAMSSRMAGNALKNFSAC
ncbi:hypothetical protein BD410DRAFT_846649 [Rickenella mellea]|uniref:Uncharacterized protein n=1 Tax=Rickenella mellea TaxID=50990 RepID=A0A4Y7PEI2_9AGAM|nr:hypothetical protein BD410DRAFT_846649 [Rickenella mellea]